jgi:uncharacterized sulfatase
MPKQAVLFLIDTQGTNYVGVYAGLPELGTAHIDKFAAQGVRFDRAYSCSPVCGPARSAIFTGLYPHSNGVLGNDHAPHLDIPTLGQRLSDAGIHAAYIGKWHLDGTDYFGSGKAAPGWDPAYWFDGRNYLESLPDQNARDLSRRVLSPEEVRANSITAEFTHAHRTTDRAIDFIRRYREEDFLLVVSIDEPHHPFICPEPFASAFEDFEYPIGPSVDDPLIGKPREQQEWAQVVAPARSHAVRERDGKAYFHHPHYFACNSYCDFEVGRVLAEIDQQIPQALVVYTADHGELGFAHGMLGKGPVVYEEITRIPLLVRWPGQAPAGAVAPHPITHVDLVPAFLDYFAVSAPPLLQGKSLLEVLRDPSRQIHDAIFMEFNRFEVDHDGFGAFFPQRSVYDGRYKLALNLLDTDEFYDLQTDPHEMHNRVLDPAYAGERDRLHDKLLDWMNQTRDAMRGPHWARRPWRDVSESAFKGPTRPRPFDEAYFPTTLLYETGRVIDRLVYDKK